MIFKCANPECSVSGGSYAWGKLHAVPLVSTGSVMFIWLCDDCSNVVHVDGGGSMFHASEEDIYLPLAQGTA
jgi:hypothetical protein